MFAPPSFNPVAADHQLSTASPPLVAWMAANGLAAVSKAFIDEGFEEIEDVYEFIKSDTAADSATGGSEFKRLVPQLGHRTKLQRLLTAAFTCTCTQQHTSPSTMVPTGTAPASSPTAALPSAPLPRQAPPQQQPGVATATLSSLSAPLLGHQQYAMQQQQSAHFGSLNATAADSTSLITPQRHNNPPHQHAFPVNPTFGGLSNSNTAIASSSSNNGLTSDGQSILMQPLQQPQQDVGNTFTQRGGSGMLLPSAAGPSASILFLHQQQHSGAPSSVASNPYSHPFVASTTGGGGSTATDNGSPSLLVPHPQQQLAPTGTPTTMTNLLPLPPVMPLNTVQQEERSSILPPAAPQERERRFSPSLLSPLSAIVSARKEASKSVKKTAAPTSSSAPAAVGNAQGKRIRVRSSLFSEEDLKIRTKEQILFCRFHAICLRCGSRHGSKSACPLLAFREIERKIICNRR